MAISKTSGAGIALLVALFVPGAMASERQTSPAEERTSTEAEERTTTEAEERDTSPAEQRQSRAAEERETGEVYERDEGRDRDDEVDARQVPPARAGTPEGGEHGGAPTPPQ
ncbi:MAG: hypothetical protein JJU06_05105 [Ectothiorhodospiraceae bacterium]|nr:hypothetical protein [Ectothiorhodospiraceae bacterium]MCH8503614.1 hypothetical protein [Ectothiorhodospiraceae bacterium]